MAEMGPVTAKKGTACYPHARHFFEAMAALSSSGRVVFGLPPQFFSGAANMENRRAGLKARARKRRPLRSVARRQLRQRHRRPGARGIWGCRRQKGAPLDIAGLMRVCLFVSKHSERNTSRLFFFLWVGGDSKKRHTHMDAVAFQPAGNENRRDACDLPWLCTKLRGSCRYPPRWQR